LIFWNCLLQGKKEDEMSKAAIHDMQRYYGEEKEGLKRRILRSPQLKFIIQLRKTQACKNKIVYMINKWKLDRMSRKTMIQILPETNIGKGFYIGHFGSIIINPKAVLGMNCNVAVGVTIGQENRGGRKGAPVIGNRVWIGTNAVVVGNVTIGDDVLIAPNTYVNFDVPSHSVVVGNPAKIISKENAVEGYINNCV